MEKDNKIKKLREKLYQRETTEKNMDNTEALLYLATGRVPPESLRTAFDTTYYPIKKIAKTLTDKKPTIEFHSKLMAQCVKTVYPELTPAAEEFEKNLDEAFSRGTVSEDVLRNIGKKICEKHNLKDQYDFSSPLTNEQRQSLGAYIKEQGSFITYSMQPTLNNNQHQSR